MHSAGDLEARVTNRGGGKPRLSRINVGTLFTFLMTDYVFRLCLLGYCVDVKALLPDFLPHSVQIPPVLFEGVTVEFPVLSRGIQEVARNV